MHTRPELAEGSTERFGETSKSSSKGLSVDTSGPGLPLTPTQEELISLIDIHNETRYVSFRIPISEHISPSLDLIQHAWRAVASHNPALRARLALSSGKWKLHISRKIPNIEFYDPNAEPQVDHTHSARLTARLSGGKLSAWMTIHRAHIDDQSLPLIRDDFESFLNGLAFVRHPDFESFIDRTATRDQNAARLYWRAQSVDVITTPIHGFPAKTTTLSSYADSRLSKEDTRWMYAFAAACHGPIQSVLYAAWAATLATHTETASNVVTFAVTGRHLAHDQDHRLVGPGDQIYPLVIDIHLAQSLTDMIQSITAADKRAAKYAFIGYNAILEQLVEPEGPTLVSVRTNNKSQPLEHTHAYFDRFSLVLEIEISDHIALTIHHSDSVLKADAQIILEHYITAIRSIIREDAHMVGDINLVSSSERDYLLKLAEPLTSPREGLVHELFEAQVEKTPDLPAVQFENDTALSYRQLNGIANGVARRLACGRGSYIPVCMQRSTNLIVALCAILKSGAGYVITDPDVPVQRNNFIYSDVSAEFAIVDQRSKGTFPNEVLIEDLVAEAEQQDTSNLHIHQRPDDIVYVIYTSGSTGNPKGVLLEHRAAYSGLAAFPFIPDLRQLLFHNPVFSAAQRSVWSTLKQGGCLCLASKENLTVHIGRTINEMRIDTIDVTPSTALFITPSSVPNLKRMTVAGELINPALVPPWIDRLELLNAYGLSENTQFNWRHTIAQGQNPQNIGRPIDTTTVFVLKPGNTELSPLLVPGELCLGGHQLARGYLNRPEKTREAFIANPFGPGRLYRTGDLVVTHADGSIEMIGRIDFSVKINDQRVDPGESNSIIQLHPHVRDSCVVAASVAGRIALVAAIVHGDESLQDATQKEIRQRLEKQLPQYMIPLYWTSRKDLPLNINGKVDVPALRKICEDLGRHGLLAPSKQASNPIVTADTPAERSLRDLFAQALSVSPDEVALDASFAENGGTSLEAIKVASVASEAGFQISAAQLLLGTTLSELAMSVQRTQAMERASPAHAFELAPPGFPIDADHMEDVLPSTPLQEGIMAESLIGSANYMLARLYRLRGITVDQVQQALQTVLNARPLLRTTFVAHGSSFLQVIQKHVDLPFQNSSRSPNAYLQYQRRTAEAVGLDAPLVRLVSLDDSIVSIETHHALVDTWSYHYIQDDVRAALRGKQLDDRPAFRHYIRHLITKEHAPAHRFWNEYLRDATPTTLETSDGAAFTAQIELSKDLFDAQPNQSAPDAAILYASWAVVLSTFTLANDVVFLVNISGRETPIPDILTIQGPTLSTVPMRVRTDDAATIQQLTQRIASEFWKITDHAHIGLRNIFKATGMNHALANTGANFLISLDEPSDDGGLEPLDVKYPNVRNLVTIEMNHKSPHCIQILSSRGLVAADDILAATKFVFETALQAPHMTVRTLRARIDDVTRTKTAAAPSRHTPEATLAHPRLTHQNTSSEPLSPQTDPAFDDHDDDVWDRSSPRTESVSSAPGDDPQPGFEVWREYMKHCSPTVIESAPATHTAVQTSIPLVKLHAAAAKANVHYETILAASFGILLARHTETDPLFGLAVDQVGRATLADQEPTFFVPQRMSLPERATLQHVIRSFELNADCEHPPLRSLRIHQALEFAKYYSTAFDSLLLIQSLSITDVPEAWPLTQHRSPLTVLQAIMGGRQVRLHLSGRISSQRAHFLLGQMSHIIQTVISAPGTDVRSLDLVSSAERSVLHGLAQCHTLEPALVHSYFESYAATSPGHQALQLEDGASMTYQELNVQANRLARHLIQLGVVPDAFVPLYLDKSADMIVAILAVLKTGATYVPLSPDNPAKRNRFVMEQVQASIILSQTQYEEFDALHSAVTVFTDRLPSLDHLDTSDTEIGKVNTIAYCLFTSGSTGTPKGVQVSHRAISIAVQGHLRVEKTTAATRHLLFANYTFDVSVHDIFSVLGSGATLCVVSMKRLMSDLVDVMNEMRVTQTFFTPTVARLLTPRQVPTMETLLCGGEPLTTDIIDAWAKDCTLINMYGPTELAVDVTYNWIDHATKSTALGRPLDTCSIMIVERNRLSLAPLGAIGELCVAGGHLADGYLNRADLTAKVFVPCPVPGFDLMYRTGDLGRWLPDGTLEYLGRIDHQIKLNGHRIELGEIEQVIVQSGLTHECVALVLDQLTRPQLAIFCVFDAASPAGLHAPASKSRLLQLCEHLSSLAHYMVPHYVFPVSSIPRMSASNKSDRKALKQLAEALSPHDLSAYALAAAQAARDEGFEMPSSEEEKLLQKIWADIFMLPQNSIGATSNFSVLGGDSISAINLVSACRRRGYVLGVNDILKLKTLKQIALQLTSSEDTKPWEEKRYEPPTRVHELLDERGIANEEVEYVYPCAPGQSEFLSHGHTKDQDWTVTAIRPLHHNAEAYLDLLQKLTAIHDILRTTFACVPGHGWVGVVLRDPIVNFTTRTCKFASTDKIVDEVKKRRFVFGEPFVRYVLLRYPDGSHDLITKMDHGLWDGTSLRIFDTTVQALQLPGNPPPNTPFREFALDHWRSDKSESLQFWRQVVQDMRGSDAHVMQPRTDNVWSQVVPSELPVNELARTCGVTPATVFQGIFQLWLAAYRQDSYAAYDYLLTGRNVDLPNPQSINGVCANFLPFYLPVTSDQPLPDYFANIQDFFWQATKYGNIGLDDIYMAAGLDRSSVANRVLFLYQPFEPTDTHIEAMRWVVLAMSRSWMTQPYALMEEVHKTNDGYKLVIKYDSRVHDAEAVQIYTKRQIELLRRGCERMQQPTIVKDLQAK